MTRPVAFDAHDVDILATAQDRGRWMEPMSRPDRQFQKIRVNTMTPSVVVCTCKGRISDERPGVMIRYGAESIVFHVDCLKTLMGALGSEPDRLAQLAAARGKRRLIRT